MVCFDFLKNLSACYSISERANLIWKHKLHGRLTTRCGSYEIRLTVCFCISKSRWITGCSKALQGLFTSNDYTMQLAWIIQFMLSQPTEAKGEKVKGAWHQSISMSSETKTKNKQANKKKHKTKQNKQNNPPKQKMHSVRKSKETRRYSCLMVFECFQICRFMCTFHLGAQRQ